MKVPSLRFKNQTKINILKKILTITCINETLNEDLFYGKWEEPMHELKIMWCFLIVNRRFKCYLYDQNTPSLCCQQIKSLINK